MPSNTVDIAKENPKLRFRCACTLQRRSRHNARVNPGQTPRPTCSLPWWPKSPPPQYIRQRIGTNGAHPYIGNPIYTGSGRAGRAGPGRAGRAVYWKANILETQYTGSKTAQEAPRLPTDRASHAQLSVIRPRGLARSALGSIRVRSPRGRSPCGFSILQLPTLPPASSSSLQPPSPSVPSSSSLLLSLHLPPVASSSRLFLFIILHPPLHHPDRRRRMKTDD